VVALLASPILVLKARRALIGGAARSIERIYAEAEREAVAVSPSTPRVTLKYHTYSGLLIHSVHTEHFLELPYPVAERTLDALLFQNLTYGFFAEGVLVIPVLGYINYLTQRRSIRRQAESPGGARVDRPRPGESGLEKWGGAAMVLMFVC